jgi:hypothetical protein
LLPHAQAFATQWGPGPQPLWQSLHWTPVPPHWLSTLPGWQVPPASRFEQQPPLHPVFAPPQRPWHWCSAVEQAFNDAQSVATLQPQAPFTQAKLFAWELHGTQAPPPVPHAEPERPDTQLPFWQQPPWQAWFALHDVVHVVPLHAYPEGQSVVVEHRLVHAPDTQVWVKPQTCPTPQPPQLFGSDVTSTQAPPHIVYPVSHTKVHEPPLQTGVAWLTLVVHDLPQPPQLVRSVAVFVQPPPQRDGVEAGQPEEQAYGPPSTLEGAQRGVPPSVSHAAPQLPQLLAVVYETHPPSHAE